MNRLKPLRRRFITINMITLTILLVMAFSGIIAGSIHHSASIAKDALHLLIRDSHPMNLNLKNHPPLPPMKNTTEEKNNKAARALPGMVLLWDDEEKIASVLLSRNMTVNDNEAKHLAEMALSGQYENGWLPDDNLSFLIRQTTDGTKISFVDRAPDYAAFLNLLLFCVIGFVLSWGLFLLMVWRISLWAFRPVEIAWQQQRQFIADASHELKTPITVILANMHILKNHADDTIKAQARWIESSNEEALRMKKLVSDMLILARNDAGESTAHYTTDIQFSDLVFGAILSFEAVALEHGLHIEEHITPDLHLNGDETQLKELLNILLDNACKYALPPSTIHAHLFKDDHSIHFTVHNTCAPLDEDTLAHLFERFYRTDASRTRETGGYGLGLAIAESICSYHHGRISATNEGDGLTLHVTLPLEQKPKHDYPRCSARRSKDYSI